MKEPLLPITANGEEAKLFRIEEYRILLDHIASLSSRRQNVDTVFIGLNTVFLTGIGFILFSFKFSSWSIPMLIASLTIFVSPINFIWFSSANKYRHILDYYFDYLREIEAESRALYQAYAQFEVGVFSRFKGSFIAKGYGSVDNQTELPTYFLGAYPIIALGVAALTLLVVNQIIPAFNF